MSKKSGIIILVVALLTLCFSGVALIKVLSPAEETGEIQYVLYLGTNDKDTNEPVCSPEEAQEKAEQVLIDHFGGYTISEAHGGWEYEGTRYSEYTLIIYLSDTTLDEVHAASEDLIEVFHQSSVLIQANETTTEFYSGS